jgi:hypothetical protein
VHWWPGVLKGLYRGRGSTEKAARSGNGWLNGLQSIDARGGYGGALTQGFKAGGVKVRRQYLMVTSMAADMDESGEERR